MSRTQRATDTTAAARLALLGRWRIWLLAAGGLLLASLVFLAFRDLANEISYADVVGAVRGVDPHDLVLALLATAISYLALTGYDHSSLRYVGASVPYRVVAQTSFIAYALTNTIGLGVFTGGAVRMRLYGAAGVEAGKVSQAIAFNAVAFGLGISTVGALGLLWDAQALAPLVHLPAWLLSTAAALVLMAIASMLAWCRDGRERRLFGRFPLRLPKTSLALQQLLWSTLDIFAAGAVLWVLLPDGAIGFPAFIGFYAAAIVLGVLSHVPGGLGVFEAVLVFALGGRVPGEALAGALVLYRLVYYVLPLLLAMVLMVLHELRRGAAAPVTQAMSSLAPLLLAAYTLVVGGGGAGVGGDAGYDEATELLALHVPLPLVEASHFLSSIAGLGHVVRRPRHAAATRCRLVGGTVALAALSLLMVLPKGIAVSEALLLGCRWSPRLRCRGSNSPAAHRCSRVPFSGGWLVAVAVICVALTSFAVLRLSATSTTRGSCGGSSSSTAMRRVRCARWWPYACWH